MWEMFDESNFEVECDNECGAGSPPIFNLPPPPRPDFMQELSTCSENSLSDYEMCEAIPVSIFMLSPLDYNELYEYKEEIKFNNNQIILCLLIIQSSQLNEIMSSMLSRDFMTKSTT